MNLDWRNLGWRNLGWMKDFFKRIIKNYLKEIILKKKSSKIYFDLQRQFKHHSLKNNVLKNKIWRWPFNMKKKSSNKGFNTRRSWIFFLFIWGLLEYFPTYVYGKWCYDHHDGNQKMTWALAPTPSFSCTDWYLSSSRVLPNYPKYCFF